MSKTCLSTKQEIVNNIGSVTFLCPNCKKGTIVRSRNAREIVSKYVCPECGFEGPN